MLLRWLGLDELGGIREATNLYESGLESGGLEGVRSVGSLLVRRDAIMCAALHDSGTVVRLVQSQQFRALHDSSMVVHLVEIAAIFEDRSVGHYVLGTDAARSSKGDQSIWPRQSRKN